MTILTGDCIEVMRTLDADSVDAVVTDPPYGLEFMGKKWDSFATERRKDELTPRGEGHSTSAGPFLAHAVNQYVAGTPFQAWCEAWGREALRVTKPGGYLLAFGGTRTHHRLVCGLEDAGWIIRDELDWIYASGFPKGKANLKPAHEPIVLARKPGPLRPLAIDACRIDYVSEADRPTQEEWNRAGSSGKPGANGYAGQFSKGLKDAYAEGKIPVPPGRWPSNVLLSDPDLFDVANPGVVGSGAVTDGATSFSRPKDYNASSYRVGDAELQPGYGDTGGYSRFFLIPQRYNGSCQQCGRAISADSPSYRLSPSADSAPSDAPTLPAGTPDSTAPDSSEPDATGRKSSTSATEQTSWNGDAETTPSTLRSKRRGTLPASEPPSSPAKSPDAASPATDTTTTTPSRSMCATCVEAITSPTTSDSDELRDYPIAWIIPKADRADREPVLRGQLEKRNAGVAIRAAEPGEYDEFVYPAPEGIGRWLREHREAAGLSAKALCAAIGAHGEVNHGGAVSNWEQELNRPTPEQWRKLREVLRFDDRYDEVMTTTTKVDRKLMDGALPARRENGHPTVKPVDLMRHLIRLVTPVGGTVLDCFLGSGTTAIAAEMEGFAWIGIEREPEYVAIAEARLNGVQRGLGLDVPAPTSSYRPPSEMPPIRHDKTTEAVWASYTEQSAGGAERHSPQESETPGPLPADDSTPEAA